MTRDYEMKMPTEDQIHNTALIEHFKDHIGNKALIISPSLPFFFIGTIKEVVEDLLFLDVETTPIQELENRIWSIQITRIELFFIETEKGPKLPELDDHIC